MNHVHTETAEELLKDLFELANTSADQSHEIYVTAFHLTKLFIELEVIDEKKWRHLLD
jgi:hypothetical protein